MKKEGKKGREKERGRKESRPEGKAQGLCLLRGMAVAFAITCILFIGFGILLTYTSLSEETLPMVSLGCTALSAAAAGHDWAACIRKRGILWGALAGVVYSVLLYALIGLAGKGFQPQLSALMTLIVAVAAGAIGGILGVNGKK